MASAYRRTQARARWRTLLANAGYVTQACTDTGSAARVAGKLPGSSAVRLNGRLRNSSRSVGWTCSKVSAWTAAAACGLLGYRLLADLDQSTHERTRATHPRRSTAGTPQTEANRQSTPPLRPASRRGSSTSRGPGRPRPRQWRRFGAATGNSSSSPSRLGDRSRPS